MLHRLIRLTVLSLLTFLAPSARPSQGAVLPPGFVAESVTPGQTFDLPTGMAFLPDGRILVAEKAGRLRVVQNGVLLSTPMWAAETEILSNGDRGLVGLAVDPNYATNRYIYLAYVVDPDSNGFDDDWLAWSRLVRFQTSLSNSNLIDPSTRTILFGNSWADGIPSGSDSHTIDCLRFAPDGSLLVSAGDGANYNGIDAGGQYNPIFYPGRLDTLEDIGAFRAQYLDSKAGKILRLDPATGFGLSSNPFYDGNPTSNRSRVYAYGLRNPFRMTIRPGTGSVDSADGDPGTLYVGDVGYADWEEINVLKVPGMNLGWPCYEGPYPQPGYQAATPNHHGCGTIGTPVNPSPVTHGLISWHHIDADLSLPPVLRGNSSTGGCFYTGTRYPAAYQGAFFMGELGLDWIKVARVSPADSLLGVEDFADGTMGPVEIAPHPVTGDLLYLAIYTGELLRIRYTPTPPVNLAPTAVASAGPLVGVAPLTVTLSSAGSSDPESDSLGFGWVFGDGGSDIGPTQSHTYLTPGVYSVVLAADDGQGNVGRDTLEVAVLASTAFPVTPLLDDFNRPDSTNIGPNWSGDSAQFSIEASTLHQANPGGRLAWSPTPFGAAQEAYFSFYEMTPGSGYDLFLKLQADTTTEAGLRVRYDVDAATVSLSAFSGGAPETLLAGPLALPCADGDQLGARVYSNGAVQVFRNGTPAATWSAAGWPFALLPGRIGVGITGNGGAHLDDFGGGAVVLNSNTPPGGFILSPPDSSFYSTADSIYFSAAVSDAEDPPSALVTTWDLDLRHNNHTHPSTYQRVGLTAAYLPVNHDDGTGVYLTVRMKVSDTGGLSTTRRLDIFPEVDLHPAAPIVLPASPTAIDSLTFSFRIHNTGRMPAPTSRWRLTEEGTPLAEGTLIVPAADSVDVSLTLPPSLGAGSHAIGLSVDVLNRVYETNEGNNGATMLLQIADDVSGLPGGTGRRATLSGAYPNPSSASIHWQLALPAPATVQVEVFDIQGRRLWQGEPAHYLAGRWALTWPGTLSSGQRAPSGIYMARISVVSEPDESGSDSSGSGGPGSTRSGTWTQRVIRLN